MIFKHVRRFTILSILMLLSACTSYNKPVTPTPSPQNALGIMEIVFDGVGTEGMRSHAVFQPYAGVDSQSINMTTLAKGIQLSFASNGYFDTNGIKNDDGCVHKHGTRYLYVSFLARNAEHDRDEDPKNNTAYSNPNDNITFVAVDANAERNGHNAVGSLTDFAGNPLANGTYIANCMKPTHRMIHTPHKGLQIIDDLSAFQAFAPDELPEAASLAGVSTIFPYGFVVSAVNGGRRLAANPQPDQFDGMVTFAVRHPLAENADDNPYRFSLTFEVFVSKHARVTQSIEEKDTNNVINRAQALITQNVDNVDIVLLGDSSTAVPSTIPSQRLCQVRVSGDGANPIYLVNSTSGACRFPEGRIYVDNSLDDSSNRGTSWEDAYMYLQDALLAARTSDIKEIWIRGGTGAVYHPNIAVNPAAITDHTGTATAQARQATFYVTEGIKLYGGFKGTENNLAERTYIEPTILSGDIDANDTNLIATAVADIQGDNAYHVLYLDGAPNPISQATLLQALIITAGQATGNSPHHNGGGVYCDANNEAAICSPLLENMTIQGNDASRYGGGFFNAAEFGRAKGLFDNVTFTSNHASSGGAMANYAPAGIASPTIAHSNFTNNAANYGGAIHSYAISGVLNDPTNPNPDPATEYPISGQSHPDIQHSIFVANTATQNGGALFSDAGDGGTVNPKVTNAVFERNSAANGGAIYNSAYSAYDDLNPSAPSLLSGISISISLSTFSRNQASNNGGAIYNTGAHYNSINNPVLDGVTANLALSNSILWGNTAQSHGNEIYSDYVDGNAFFNLISGGINGPNVYFEPIQAGDNPSNIPIRIVDGGGNINANPNFANANTGNLQLQAGSPAINAGDNGRIPAGVTKDILGNRRIQAGRVDMGAYEAVAP